MSQYIKPFIALCFIVSLTACSTMEGIGKDLKKGGNAIQKAANS